MRARTQEKEPPFFPEARSIFRNKRTKGCRRRRISASLEENRRVIARLYGLPENKDVIIRILQ